MDKGYYQKYEPVFGVWKIADLLGEGSFGKVFELEREDFGVTYRAALKAITIPTSENEILDARAEGMDEASIRTHFSAFTQELAQEFALMSRFKGNSNIVSYENHQVIPHEDGIGWDILIQMELLTPLNRHVAEHGMTRRDVIRLGIDLCRALELCQKHDVIHRDVKPENILVSKNGDYKLGDFGIARMVKKAGSALSRKGTDAYMAPEVYKGEEYDGRADIYSLGLVMYRLLNGNRAPFLPPAPAYISPENREKAFMRRMSGKEALPVPLHADGKLAEIVLKACAYAQEARYESPAQMRRALEALQANPEAQEAPEAALPAGAEAQGTPSNAEKTHSTFDGISDAVSGHAEDDLWGRGFADEDATHEMKPAEPANEGRKDDARDERPADDTKAVNPAGEGREVGTQDARPAGKGRKSGTQDARPAGKGRKSGTQDAKPADAWRKDDTQAGPDVTAETDGRGGGAAADGKRTAAPSRKKKRLWRWIALGLVVALCACGIVKRERLYDLYSIYKGGDNPWVEWSGTDYLRKLTNLKGQLLREPQFNADGSVTVMAYRYDAQGLAFSYELDLLGSCMARREYRRDAYGRTTEEISYANDGSIVSTCRYEYTVDGYIVRLYDAGDALTGSSVYTEDAQGNILSVDDRDENGVRTSVTRYDEMGIMRTYDANDQLTETTWTEDRSDGGRDVPVFVPESPFTPIRKYTYNAQGQLTRHERNQVYGEEDKAYVVTYTYNELGQRSLSLYSTPEETTETRYTYDGRGYLATAQTFRNNVLCSEYLYVQGQVSRHTEYSDDGTCAVYQQEYDESGNLLFSSTYSPEDGHSSSTTHEYDGQNREVRAETYSDGALIGRDEYEYDSQGRQVRVNRYTGNGADLRLYYAEVCEYGESGETRHGYTYDANGALLFENQYQFDAQGRELRLENYDANHTLESFCLSYYDGTGREQLEYYGLPFDGDQYSVVRVTFDENGYDLISYIIERYTADGARIDYRVFNSRGEQTFP